MIKGIVCTGLMKASKIPEDIFQNRCRAAEATLTRGTLNVHVEDLSKVLSQLGSTHFSTDLDNKAIGPLDWWKIKLFHKKLDSSGVDAFIVRHQRTKTRYLEIMSREHLRGLGLLDGDCVEMEIQAFS